MRGRRCHAAWRLQYFVHYGIIHRPQESLCGIPLLSPRPQLALWTLTCSFAYWGSHYESTCWPPLGFRFWCFSIFVVSLIRACIMHRFGNWYWGHFKCLWGYIPVRMLIVRAPRHDDPKQYSSVFWHFKKTCLLMISIYFTSFVHGYLMNFGIDFGSMLKASWHSFHHRFAFYFCYSLSIEF